MEPRDGISADLLATATTQAGGTFPRESAERGRRSANPAGASGGGSDFRPPRFRKLLEDPDAARSAATKTAAHPFPGRAHPIQGEVRRPPVSSHDGDRRAELCLLPPIVFSRQEQRTVWLGPALPSTV